VKSSEMATCGFCEGRTDYGLFGDGVTLVVKRAGSIGDQTLYAHLNCIRERLYDGFPLGPALEDWPDC
jgi:hypothetical protein